MKRISAAALTAGILFAWTSALLGAAAPASQPASRPASRPAPADPAVAAAKGWDDKSRAAFLQRHEGFLKDKEVLLKKGPVQLVLIGDSITDGWRGKQVFQAAFGKYNPYNIGIGGDRTEHVLWRIDNGELDGLEPNPKVAMIMIGTNNLGGGKDERIAAAIEKIVQQVRQKLPQTKVLLLGIFPRSEKADHPSRARIKTINQAIAKLDDGGKTVRYLDIGDKFLAADGTLPKDVMPDFLHPNAKGYLIWADAVTPVLEEMAK